MSSAATQMVKNISALQVTYTENGSEVLGMFTQLPRDGGLRICGDGFNDRTIKVNFRGLYYFVFREDIEPSPSP
jgi:hypothetical protein